MKNNILIKMLLVLLILAISQFYLKGMQYTSQLLHELRKTGVTSHDLTVYEKGGQSQMLKIKHKGSGAETVAKKSCGKNDWSFLCKVSCPEFFMDRSYKPTRKQLVPSCANGSLSLLAQDYRNKSIPRIRFREKCMQKVVSKHCSGSSNVPSVVHYIWFGSRELNFYNFLSIFSANKFLRPCLILIHADVLPYGQYWDYLVGLLKNLIHVKRTPPTHIYGRKIKFIEHKADWARMEALKEYGGIYIDTDTIILRSLDPLCVHNFTMSTAFDYNLSNGLIMSRRNATFLNIWMKSYTDYNPSHWGHNSLIVPFQLSKKFPSYIHVENKTFVRPDYEHTDLIFKSNFNWSLNYAIHLFNRVNKTAHDFNDIRYLNTTVGSVSRYVLLGSKELCEK